MKRAMIAMSGGVDSSVAAFLSLQGGYEAVGVTLKLYDNEDIGAPREKTCCSLDDIEDARSVAARLDMPFYVFNYRDAFDQTVIRRFVDTYCAGDTPNPCIDCNRFIKFDKMLEQAVRMEMDAIVTGHYARIEQDAATGRYLLKKAADTAKDQSYVLYSLTQAQLARTLFPLGEMTKPQVRAIAEEHGFLNAKKRDSQDICFVPDGDYAAFIERSQGRRFPAGDFVDLDGKVLGRHRGSIRYTIGQRRGLGLALPAPLYVVEKDLERNRVVLGPQEALLSRRFTVREVNLIGMDELSAPVRVKVRVRYKQPEQWAVVEQTGPDTLRVEFDAPQRAIAPGQAAVLYDGDYVLGGGTIAEVLR